MLKIRLQVPGQRSTVQRPVTLSCAASSEDVSMGRREAVAKAGAIALVLGSQAIAPGAAFAAKIPGGFNAAKDSGKGYAFAYPVGWQARSGGLDLSVLFLPLLPSSTL